MKVFQRLEPKQRRNLAILWGSGFFFWASVGALLPTMPLYVRDLGGTVQQVGFVMGAFAIGLLLSRSSLGRMSDARGRRIVLLVGTAVVAIAPLGYIASDLLPETFASDGLRGAIAFIRHLWGLLPEAGWQQAGDSSLQAIADSIPRNPIPLLFVVRIFHGISISAFTTGYSAFVADHCPPAYRGELIGYMSLVQPIGVAVGPAVGGFLQAAAGYLPLFAVMATFGLLSFLGVFQVRENFSGAGDRKVAYHHISPWKLLFSPRVRVPAFVMLAIGTAFGNLTTFLPLLMREVRVPLGAGLFYTCVAIASFGVRLLSGRASDRFGRGLPIALGTFFYVSSMGTLFFARTTSDFLLAAIFEGMGAGMVIPTVVALMTDRSQPHERGRTFALCIGGFDLGIAIAGPMMGAFAQRMDYRSTFAISAAIAAIAFFVFLTQNSKNVAASIRFVLGRDRDIYAIPAGDRVLDVQTENQPSKQK